MHSHVHIYADGAHTLLLDTLSAYPSCAQAWYALARIQLQKRSHTLRTKGAPLHPAVAFPLEFTGGCDPEDYVDFDYDNDYEDEAQKRSAQERRFRELKKTFHQDLFGSDSDSDRDSDLEDSRDDSADDADDSLDRIFSQRQQQQRGRRDGADGNGTRRNDTQAGESKNRSSQQGASVGQAGNDQEEDDEEENRDKARKRLREEKRRIDSLAGTLFNTTLPMAEHALLKAIELDQNHTDAMVAYGSFLLCVYSDAHSACPLYQRAAGLQPWRKDVVLAYAYMCMFIGQADKADAAWRGLLKMRPFDNDLMVGYAEFMWRGRGLFEKAEKLLWFLLTRKVEGAHVCMYVCMHVCLPCCS
jgi:hypothetical protein